MKNKVHLAVSICINL